MLSRCRADAAVSVRAALGPQHRGRLVSARVLNVPGQGRPRKGTPVTLSCGAGHQHQEVKTLSLQSQMGDFRSHEPGVASPPSVGDNCPEKPPPLLWSYITWLFISTLPTPAGFAFPDPCVRTRLLLFSRPAGQRAPAGVLCRGRFLPHASLWMRVPPEALFSGRPGGF